MAQPTSAPASDSTGGPQAEASNQFATDLYATLSAFEGNRVFSPLSLHSALLMAEAGAHGQTADEIAAVLHVPAGDISGIKPPKTDKHLSIANAMWINTGFTLLPSYLKTVRDNFDSSLQPVNFNDPVAASQTINAWVSDKTDGKITDLLSPEALSGAVKLVLTNAIYFKADWQMPFTSSDTRSDNFHTPAGIVTTSMMRQTAGFAIMDGDGFRAIELPYQDSSLTMVILLPDSADGIGALEKKLQPAFLKDTISQLKAASVELSLPKFKFAQQTEMTRPLGELGMRLAFNPQLADFSGITGAPGLFISHVIHKAYVAVDEQGTEAAAASGIIMRPTAVLRHNISFQVDHPFIWLIRDRTTGEIVFLGRVIDPARDN